MLLKNLVAVQSLDLSLSFEQRQMYADLDACSKSVRRDKPLVRGSTQDMVAVMSLHPRLLEMDRSQDIAANSKSFGLCVYSACIFKPLYFINSFYDLYSYQYWVTC